MNVLPNISVDNFISDEELAILEKLISEDHVFKTLTQKWGKNKGQVISEYQHFNYNDNVKIKEILENKFKKYFDRNFHMRIGYLLNSINPFGIHNDCDAVTPGYVSTYTIIIPLDTYKSSTIIFNEYQEEDSNFDLFVSNYNGDLSLKMEPKFCAKNLSHISPDQLIYLTLNEVFYWNKGSMFAFDSRRFHSGDNHIKNGVSNKRGLVFHMEEVI